jgi:hypothetical protein
VKPKTTMTHYARIKRDAKKTHPDVRKFLAPVAQMSRTSTDRLIRGTRAPEGQTRGSCSHPPYGLKSPRHASSCDGIVLLTTAFRVECAIHCFNSLNALGRFRHNTRDCEVVRLTLHRKRVSAGRKAEVGILWPNHKHLAIFD